MGIGFFKRSQGPVTVTCPFCASTQPESILTVSTNCKKCFAYLKVLEGEVLEAHPVETEHTAMVEGGDHPDTSVPDGADNSPAPEPAAYRPLPPVATPPAKPDDETPPLAKDPQDGAAPGTFKESRTLPAYRPGDLPAENPAQRRAQLAERDQLAEEEALETEVEAEQAGPRYHSRPPRDNEKLVRCFDCDVSHPVPLAASSTLCPECGQYLSLENLELKGRHNNRVRTRGNVLITRRAKVAAPQIFAHDLTIEGEFSGTADCSGKLTVRRKSNLGGPFFCEELHIEEGVKVTFSGPIHISKSAEINGDVRGDVLCKGPVHLHRKALLTGALRCTKLEIDSGATHDGTISIGLD